MRNSNGRFRSIHMLTTGPAGAHRFKPYVFRIEASFFD
jgi:hypothetical protein